MRNKEDCLHDMKIVEEWTRAIKEYCHFCRTTFIYKKKPNNQLVDNNQYRKDHIRAFCQPRGKELKLFRWLYGTDSIDKRIKDHNNRLNDMRSRDEDSKIEIRNAIKDKKVIG